MVANFSIGAGGASVKRKQNGTQRVQREACVCLVARVRDTTRGHVGPGLSLHRKGTVGDARRNVTFVIRDSPMLSAAAKQWRRSLCVHLYLRSRNPECERACGCVYRVGSIARAFVALVITNIVVGRGSDNVIEVLSPSRACLRICTGIKFDSGKKRENSRR